MPPAEAGSLQPRQSCYHVRKTPPESKTAGGIILPDTCQESLNEGTVLAAGPGYRIPSEEERHSVMWCEPGDVVLFPAHCFERTDADGEEGIVRDEDLLGYIPGGVLPFAPLNDFVMVEVESRRATTSGGIHLADGQKSRPRQGKILDYGPGKMRLKGDYYGTRMCVEQILGVTLPRSVFPEDKFLKGRCVMWAADAEVLEVGSERAEFLLVRASDLLAFVEEEDASTPS